MTSEISHDSVRSASSQLTAGTDWVPDLALTQVFRPNCIEMIQPGTGKSSVISLLVRALSNEERIDRQHAESIISGLLERERHSSSAIGRGLAFPHLRTADVTHFVGAIGIASEGIPFGSRDNQPTRLVFLTLSPLGDREQHTNLLSRLVSLMQDKTVALQLQDSLHPRRLYSYLSDLDEQLKLSGSNDQSPRVAVSVSPTSPDTA